MNTAPESRAAPYRASQSSLIPPHIARSHWRETGLILGSVAAVGALLVWLSQAASGEAEAASKKVEARERAPALLPESGHGKLPAGVEAAVPVQVHVTATGEVSETKIEAPSPALATLEARALAAARTFKYTPALKNGLATDAWIATTVNFAPMPDARRLAIKGSDTIGAALGQSWAGALEAKVPDLRVEIEALGSSTGFAGLLDGSAELAASSRPIRAEEEALAQKLGIPLRHAIAGHDGIAVVVNASNPLTSVDLLTVGKVFAGKVSRWNEIGAGDAPIRALGRPSYSGTHGFFRERVLSKVGEKMDFGPLVESVESSQALVGRVVSDPNAIAYVSLSYVIPSVRALPLSEAVGGSAVAPSPTSLRDGSYPVSRPLLLYWREDASRDAIAFVDLALSPAGQALVQQAGFVPLADGEANPDAQAALKEFAEVAPKTAAEAHKSSSSRVYFDAASATLSKEARAELTSLLPMFKAGTQAVVVGNADASGKNASNGTFAKRRADAVAAQLRALGVNAASLSVRVANADAPRATNETEEGRRENRRVDILFVDAHGN